MSEPEDRVQQALAAHLEYLELGGTEPDLSHLTESERERLQSLIALLDQTEGVAFGSGRVETRDPVAASTEAGRRLLDALQEALPAGARVAPEPAAAARPGTGPKVAESWTVGTFGGRIRVWLLAEPGALESSDRWIRDLDLAFRALPGTAALAMVEPDLSCLLVQPEDTSPAIEVPGGALVARRYRRPVQPVGEAVSGYLRELIPHWEPVPKLDEQAGMAIDVPSLTRERARWAVEEQAAAGARARKTNPKRQALTALGEAEAAAIAELTQGVHEGRLGPDQVEQLLRELATER